ncbi:TetR/AcrR family transcriptional regulator [Nocardiopsis potens]|uniref:TetR/AcrR family transcriptional regulator n=1 Tax=Nocardiopsis potens TaxID=1246458 RepID=UPI000349C1BE|nr:TetR/AcrR family transcriptional regulator [Nocardiopsis potens]
MPPPNPHRRRALADAAVSLLADRGAHGLTHRSVEALAEVPAGTASNYFRSREALLVAAAERIVELHLADMEAATAAEGTGTEGAAVEPSGRPWWAEDAEAFADLLAESLWTAATALRERYLAVFELQLEARRSPALTEALAGLGGAAVRASAGLHTAAGSPVPEAAVPIVGDLYAGVLFTLVARPAETLDREAVRARAAAIVHGALAAAPAPTAPDGGPGPEGRP